MASMALRPIVQNDITNYKLNSCDELTKLGTPLIWRAHTITGSVTIADVSITDHIRTYHNEQQTFKRRRMRTYTYVSLRTVAHSAAVLWARVSGSLMLAGWQRLAKKKYAKFSRCYQAYLFKISKQLLCCCSFEILASPSVQEQNVRNMLLTFCIRSHKSYASGLEYKIYFVLSNKCFEWTFSASKGR